jgi:hypothetical protein
MLRPQGFGLLVPGETGVMASYSTCALGAAFDARGLLHVHAEGYTVERLPVEWVDFWNRPGACPSPDVYLDCQMQFTIQLVITHLNDRHRWTREKIADWVETIEKRLEAEVLEPSTQHLEPPCGPRDSEAGPIPEPAVLLETVGV